MKPVMQATRSQSSSQSASPNNSQEDTDATAEYHGTTSAPCHVWAGFLSMQHITKNIESLDVKDDKLLKISQAIFQKWPGLPRVKAVFDSDGKELTSTPAPITGFFSREHEWDKHYDASSESDYLYVSHIYGREEIATVAMAHNQQCLVVVTRLGQPSAKRVGNMTKFVERAVLVDRGWLKGHMFDVVLKNCGKLSNLFDEKFDAGQIKESQCPKVVMDARIQDAVMYGSTSKSAVELTLFENLDAGVVRVKVGKTVHIQLKNGCGEIGGTIVTTDARLRRIVTAYVAPYTGIQTLDAPEHRLISRWLMILVYIFLRHIVRTKPDHCCKFERYSNTLGRYRWTVPILLHIAGCDTQPNFLPAVSEKRRSYVRIVTDPATNAKHFMSTDKQTAVALGVPFGEFKPAESLFTPTNPTCVSPGTASFGTVACGRLRVGNTIYFLNNSRSSSSNNNNGNIR